MNVVRHDDIATYTPEIRSLPCCDESSGRVLVRQQRSSPVSAYGEENNDCRNPTATVEKCAGFFRSRRRTAFGGVAELRPPSESVFTALIWFRLLPTCECAFRCMAIESQESDLCPGRSRWRVRRHARAQCGAQLITQDQCRRAWS